MLINFMNIRGNLLNSHQMKFPWRKKQGNFWKGFKIFILIFIALFVLAAIFAFPFAIKAKLIYDSANKGKENLEIAQEYAVDLDFYNAQIYLEKAENNFSSAQEGTDDLLVFPQVPWAGKQIRALNNLLITSLETTRALRDVVVLADDIFGTISRISELRGDLDLGDKSISFSEFTPAQKREILQSFFETAPLLESAREKINLAMTAFSQIPEDEIFAPLRNAMRPVKERLPELHETLAKAAPAVKILPRILGYPEPKTYLFLLQNNDELRPTGGFIGTYGIVKMDTAEILTFATDNIYKLDAPAEGILQITPPEPLRRYTEVQNWYLRDANWSPDYPEAVRRVEDLYLREATLAAANVEPGSPWYATVEPSIDGVIAITPELIEDLMRLVGDITVRGQRFTSENLVEVLQYEVEKAYYEEGVPDIQRKEIIGELSLALKDKLFSLPASKWPEALNILKNNLNEKQILIYDKDPAIQELLRQNNWDGQLIDTDGDYLMVVDANLASLKTDQVMERDIFYNVEKRGNDFFAMVEINYNNTGTFTWKTTRYRTYTRVYVPEGSQLIRGEGMLVNDKLKAPTGRKGKIDVVSELGKTYFGAFISIEPGESRSLIYEYKLPENVANLYRRGLYNLYVQKQPGTIRPGLTVELDFDKNITNWQSTNSEADKIDRNSIRFMSDLHKDRIFGVRF